MGTDNTVGRLAAAIADGLSPDWKGVARGASAAQRSSLKQLQLIARIAGLYRSGDETPASAARALSGAAAGPTAGQRTLPVEGRWGDLVLIEEVGRGSFGTVYRAHDPQLDRPVAVKLLRRTVSDDEIVGRLLREGQALAQIKHPNVVTVFGAGQHDGRAGLWMEFIRGMTLEQMLANHGPFGPGEATNAVMDVCNALEAVHHAGLVHRDVKAQNVMREEGGRLVLMDFGTGQTRAERRATRGHVIGTPLYLAPELLLGGEATFASDVYSVGVLLYHLMTNDFPVKAASLSDLVRAHRRGLMTPIQDVRPNLPRGLAQIVERALQRNPSKRYVSARSLATALSRNQGRGVRIQAPQRPTTSIRGSARGQDFGIASVAVLPFMDMSPAKNQESFCDGMAEELSCALVQMSGLRIVGRTSTFQFKGLTGGIRHIGEALNVVTILSGSVRKHGDRVRIKVELTRCATGEQLMVQQFDRELRDVFDVQGEIATAVVDALRGKLSGDKRQVRRPAARNLEAYDAYLEGRYHWNKRTETALEKSVGYFERALEIDPQYAQASVGLADACVMLGTYGARPAREVMPRAHEAVTRALTLDHNLAEAYACRGCVRSVFDWSWAEAEQDFQRAFALNPYYATAHHWYAINHLVPLRRFDEATEALRRALALDPLALAIRTSVGMKSYFAGQYEEAVSNLARTIALDDRFGMAHFFLGATYTEQGRFPEAFESLEKAIRLSGRTPEILAALGYLHGVAGDKDSARGVLSELTRLAAGRYVSPAKIAQVQVGLGDTHAALDAIEAACAEHAADLAWVAVRPVYSRLRAESRFAAVRQRLNLAQH